MDKVIVAYWSQTGNTAAMAAAVGEGITEAGKEAVVTDISSVSMDDLKEKGFYTNIPIGNGQIVHAASRRSGIKISTWNYRKPVTIRRVIP